MISVNNPKFQLGQTLATPGAQEALAATGESPWTADDNGKREATTILLPEEY